MHILYVVEKNRTNIKLTLLNNTQTEATFNVIEKCESNKFTMFRGDPIASLTAL